MFSESKRKRMPNFVRYVERRSPEVARDDSARVLAGCTLGPLAMLGIGLALAQVVSGFVAALLTLVVGTPVVVATLALVLGRLGKPRSAEEKRRAAIHTLLESVGASIERKRLHREIDPTAAQLWEAAAYYWLAIRETLDGPWWASATGQYAALREQSKRAADEAMDEIVLLGSSCMGRPGRERKDDLRDAVEDLAELDIAEALEGFKRLAGSDKQAYSHRSPNIAAVFPAMRDLAEKLKLMSAEVSDLSQKAAATATAGPESLPAASGIDLVLTELKAVRQAESELEEDQRLGY